LSKILPSGGVFFSAVASLENLAQLAEYVGLGCWVACFWWMHRISKRQEEMLEELNAVARRIERLSKAEHDLIREVHPNVEDIKKSVHKVETRVAS
jgi:hypothetical protein